MTCAEVEIRIEDGAWVMVTEITVMLTTAMVFRVLHALGCHLLVAGLSLLWLALYALLAWAISGWLGAMALAVAYSTVWLLTVMFALHHLARVLRSDSGGYSA